MNKKVGIAVLSLATLATMGGVFAYQGQPGSRNIDETTRTAVDHAIQSTDYDAFVSATQDTSKFTNMTEEHFNEMITRRAEREVYRTEREEVRQVAQEAVEAGDYNTWQEVAADFMLEKIDSEEKFLQLQEMHSYMQKGRAIAEQLGLEKGMRQGLSGERGMKGKGGMRNHQDFGMNR